MKIVFVNYDMKTGGISSSLNNLLHNIKELKDIEIDLILLSSVSSNQYKIPENINILYPSKLLDIYYRPVTDFLNTRSLYDLILKFIIKSSCVLLGNRKTLNMIFKIVKINKKYDYAISYSNDIRTNGFVGGCNDFTIKCINATQKIGWVHNDPLKLGFTYQNCKEMYKDFDYIVNVSNACKNIFDSIIPDFETKSKVVYNMFMPKEILRLSEMMNPFINNEKLKIVTVARSENNQKRLDRIITIASVLLEKNVQSFCWYILGEGPDLEILRNSVVEKKLQDLVYFIGNVENPYPYIKNADVFVLTSKYESYGMVIQEALILKTPVITTEYSAAYELIDNNFNGIICANNTKSLCNTLLKYVFNKNELNRLSNNLYKINYNNDLCIKQFLNLLGSD